MLLRKNENGFLKFEISFSHETVNWPLIKNVIDFDTFHKITLPAIKMENCHFTHDSHVRHSIFSSLTGSHPDK